MSITNEQIVLSLIAYYKSRGIDMASLLSDPVFQQLKLNEKVQAIKDHARTIVNHSVSHEKMDKGIKADILSDTLIGSLGGLAAGATAGKIARNMALASDPLLKSLPFANRSAFLKSTGQTMLIGGLMGAGIGVASSYFKNLAAKEHRKDLMDHLNYVANNPNDIGAVGVLSALHNPSRTSPILNKVTGYLSSKMMEQAEKSYQTLPHTWVQIYNGPEPQDSQN